MRPALDSNILVYALIRDDPEKHSLAVDLLIRAIEVEAVIPAQVVGEFLNVVRRKHGAFFGEACGKAVEWNAVCPFFETKSGHILAGGAFAAQHKLQLWDSVIWQVAAAAGATVFLSEDLQDGLTLEGMTVLNPFNPSNAEGLNSLLRPDPFI